MNNSKMVFYSLLDFYPKKEIIRQEFDLLSLDDKIIYKMYVYSLPWTDDDVKDLIWEYLNGWRESVSELGKKYRKKKQKNEQRQKKYDKEREINEIQNNAEAIELERDYWTM